MKIPRKLLCILGATVLLAACDSVQENMMERAIEKETGGDADVDMRGDGSMHIENEEGTFDSGTEVPDDWPSDVTVYGDAEVQYSASVNPTTGEPGSILVMMTTDSAANVAAFYRDDLADQGWEIEGDMRMGEMVIIGGKKDDRVVSVMITEADGGTSITLGVGEEE